MNTILLKIGFRNYKKLSIYIIIITIITLILNILISFSFNISSNINKEILQKISNRKIYVQLNKNQTTEELKNIITENCDYDEIINFFDPFTISSEVLGETTLNKYVDGNFNIIEGRKPRYDSKSEILIPDKIKLNGEIINTISLLNKEIIFNIQKESNNEEHKFVVVGIYKQNKLSVINDSYITGNIKEDNDIEERYIILLKDSSKKEKVINALIKNEIIAKDYDKSTNSEYNIYFKYKNIVNIFVFLSVTVLIILYNLIINKILSEHNKTLIIMRICGYQKCYIRNNIYICFFTLVNLSYLLSTLVKMIIEKYIFYIQFNIISYLLAYFTMIGFLLMILIINSLNLEIKSLSKLIDNN